MKIHIEITDGLQEDEVVIKCQQVNDSIEQLQKVISETLSAAPHVEFYKNGEQFYFAPDQILFFETSDDAVYGHTATDAFRVKQRLYELERILPRSFMRISKSTLLNLRYVYSIQRNITASSAVSFQNSHKLVYVSRLYYKGLRERLNERGN